MPDFIASLADLVEAANDLPAIAEPSFVKADSTAERRNYADMLASSKSAARRSEAALARTAHIDIRKSLSDAEAVTESARRQAIQHRFNGLISKHRRLGQELTADVLANRVGGIEASKREGRWNQLGDELRATARRLNLDWPADGAGQ